MFQPFKEHKEDYNWVIAQNVGNGVNSDFRGPKLFDDGTQDILNKWVDFGKRYRGIVNSDMVHVSQAAYAPDESNRQRGVKMDALYHVNALNEGEKGLLWVYNQTDEQRTEIITVPMYYTGLTSLEYPPVPLKDSLGKDVKTYGQWPPNYDWLPSSEPDYRMPDSDGKVYGEAAFLKEGVQSKVLEIDSNGNARLEVTLPPMSFTYYAIYEPGQQPDVVLEVGKVKGLEADSVTEESISLKWEKDVNFTLTENGVVNEKPAITVDSYHVYRNGELIGQTFNSSFTDSGRKENKEYIYTVTAVAKGVEGSASDELKVMTKVDTTAPVVTGAEAAEANTIRITFSEPVEEASAKDTGHYTIQEGLKVQSADMADECTVVLTVDTMELLTPYNLLVKGIKDISAAGNVIEDTRNKVIYGYIAKYSFEQVAEGVIKDAFGNYHGTAYQAEELDQTYGSGIRLKGTNSSYGDLGSGLLNGRNEYSMSLWFRTDSQEKQILLSQGQDQMTDNDLTLWLEGDTLSFRVSDQDGTAAELSCAGIAAGQWNFAAVIREGDTFKLYVNGEEADAVTQAGLDAAKIQNALLLGAVKNHAGGDRANMFHGDISEVSLYSVSLKAEDLDLLYGAGLAELSSLLDSAKAVDDKLFTEESRKELTAVILELEQSDPDTMTPIEIKALKDRLRKAMDGLELCVEYNTLTALYHMDEVQGEEIGNALPGYAGKFVNGQYMRIGTPFERGAYFYDNRKNYIILPQSPINGGKDFTVNGWFKAQLINAEDLQKAGKQVILSDDAANLVLSLQNNKLVLEVGNGAETRTLTAAADIPMENVTGGEQRQAWNQFAIVYQGDTVTLYLNGKASAKDSLAGVLPGKSLTIGAGLNRSGQVEHQYNGLADEFSFYNCALDSARVEGMANELPLRKSKETNLALKKTLMSDRMDDAFRLNDGKVLDFAGKDTPWTARSQGTVGSKGLKYGVDLGAVYDIKALSLTQFFRNYGNAELRRFPDVVIQISTAADFSENVVTVLNTDEDNSMGYGAGTDQSFFSFELGSDFVLDQPVRGRYVRLISTGFCNQTGSYSGYVNVSELEVYGNAPEPAKPEMELSRDTVDLKVAGDREFVKVTCDMDTLPADMKVSSDKEEVATVTNKDGILQINAVSGGDAVVTVTHPREESVVKEIQVTVEGLTPDRMVDDAEADVKYTGSFDHHNVGRGPDPDGVYEYQKGIHRSTAAGDYAELTFTGTGIDVITTVNIDGGLQEISIDGEVITTVNTKTPNGLYPKRANQMCIFSKTDLAYGEHTIKVLNKEDNLTVDVFRVYADESKHLVSLKDAAVTTQTNMLPKLPQTVTAAYGDGSRKEVMVVWDEVTKEQVAQKGTFTVQGTVKGTAWKVKAVVTVAEGPYTITFIVDGKVYDSKTAEFGALITMPEAPFAEGRKFLGWFTNAQGGSKVEDFTISRIVYAQFEEDPAAEYQITVSNGDANGTVQVNKERAAEGEEVTVVSTPAEGYYAAGNTVSGADAGDAVAVVNHKFVMPAQDVTVYGTFAQLPEGEHAVVIAAMEHGTAAAADKAAFSEEVKITVLPDEGYRMAEGSLTVNGTAVEGDTFVMPDQTAVITAAFEAKPSYGVNCIAAVDGAVSADKAEAMEQEIVTITAAANTGFRPAQDGVKVTAADGSEIIVTGADGTYTFRMPAGGATVTAQFEVIPAPKFNLTVVNGSGSGEYEEGTLVTVTADPAAEGMRFAGWTAEGITLDNPYSTTITIAMPAGAVTITADYEDDSMRQLLRRTYEYGLTLDTTGVVETAVKRFREAMDNAKTILADVAASDAVVEAAWNELTDAIHGLGLLQGDKSVLKLLIDRAEAMTEMEDKYVPGNWGRLVTALDAAGKVMDDADAMEEDVKPAADKLLQAILEQRYKARKDILEEMINRAGEIDPSLYTEESVAVLNRVLARAVEIMENENLGEEDQQVVDGEADALDQAIRSLVRKDESGGNDSSGGGEEPGGNDPSGGGEEPGGNDPSGGGEEPGGNDPSGDGSDLSDDGNQQGSGNPSSDGSQPKNDQSAAGTDRIGQEDNLASPRTGDNAQSGLAGIMLLAGMVCICGFLCIKRKKRNK